MSGDVAQVIDAYEALRARVAELEAGEVETEWGVRYTDGDVESGGILGEERARMLAHAYRADGARLVKCETRRSPWAPVENGGTS